MQLQNCRLECNWLQKYFSRAENRSSGEQRDVWRLNLELLPTAVTLTGINVFQRKKEQVSVRKSFGQCASIVYKIRSNNCKFIRKLVENVVEKGRLAREAINLSENFSEV